MMFAACGIHVMMLACLFVYKHLMLLTGDYEGTIAIMLKFAGLLITMKKAEEKICLSPKKGGKTDSQRHS